MRAARVSGRLLVIEHVIDCRCQGSWIFDPPSRSLVGPDPTGWADLSRVPEITGRPRLQLPHHNFGPVLRSHNHDMDVVRPDIDRQQTPISIVANAFNRIAHNCPLGLCQSNGIVLQTLASCPVQFDIRGHPGCARGVVDSVNRPPIIAVEPASAGGPGEEVCWVLHAESLLFFYRPLTRAARLVGDSTSTPRRTRDRPCNHRSQPLPIELDTRKPDNTARVASAGSQDSA